MMNNDPLDRPLAVIYNGPTRDVPVAWEALEDAFENNASEVHSFLRLDNGEVVRVVDGVAEPGMFARLTGDPLYLRVDPVSSREQYRWMERFIETLEESEFRTKLQAAIDGKGAFRRFKDVLMVYPVDRERWFVFRSERLRACMDTWLQAHGIRAVARPEWRVPSAEDIVIPVADAEPAEPASSSVGTVAAAAEKPKAPRARVSAGVELARRRLRELAELVPGRDVPLAISFLEFLVERKVKKPEPGAEGAAESKLDTDEGP